MRDDTGTGPMGTESRRGAAPGGAEAGDRAEPGAVERLQRRDEMLQVLFWLEGEGFGSEMTAAGVARFLAWPEEEIRAGLEDLAADGFATRPDGDAEAGWRLTDAGRREGGRRFVAEFASILSRDTHKGGECHDPDCDCHTSPLGAAACTGARGRPGA